MSSKSKEAKTRFATSVDRPSLLDADVAVEEGVVRVIRGDVEVVGVVHVDAVVDERVVEVVVEVYDVVEDEGVVVVVGEQRIGDRVAERQRGGGCSALSCFLLHRGLRGLQGCGASSCA